MSDKTIEALSEKLDRLIDVVGRMAPAPATPPRFDSADCFVWHAERKTLIPVDKVNRVEMGLIRGIDRVRDILSDNTERFAQNLPANNVLLWGARGMGKSSLVKAVHAETNRKAAAGQPPLKLVEIHREDIESLPQLMLS